MVEGEGDHQLWGSGRGAIAGCHCRVHCSVLWWGEGRATTNSGGADVVPLLGAIAGCHCSVLWWGEGRATTNSGGADVVPLLGAIAGCHCSVLWWGEGVVPLQGAIVVC